ncbi:MarR family winged helix-turn-helix transcriptional regulator [Portibacter marinus]|uniref:MarR family winged helix-turn-helix transcriptional regulator n=1 Tax=Portibacter marinus TaxID=2898660 RepID=UPI001F1C8A64|nr:MarR family transcriptional regulator [Portibacter marinus]
MKLEEEIKQSKFNSEHHKLVLNLMYTFNWLEKPIKFAVSKHKITIPQYNILRILKGSSPNPLSPRDIKKVMIHKKSDLTRLLDRLVSKDLAHRSICPSNRRKMDITITEKGLELLEKLNPEIAKVSDERIAKNISESEAIKANELIDKLRG